MRNHEHSVSEHRALRADLKFSRELFTRADVRRFVRQIRKTGYFDCFVSDPSLPHRTVRLVFASEDQKGRMMASLEANVRVWEERVKER